MQLINPMMSRSKTATKFPTSSVVASVVVAEEINNAVLIMHDEPYKAKGLSLSKGYFQRMVTVLCNDSEIEVEDGVVCEICGLELEEFDQVTGTGIHGYYHWTCVTHVE